jgi:hypothetical protein
MKEYKVPVGIRTHSGEGQVVFATDAPHMDELLFENGQNI